jgi:ATP dependent DNA ligase domain
LLDQVLAPMLAQLDYRLPVGQQWRYEPKLDGFRGLLWHRSSGQAQLLSRNTRDLGQWFPELTRAARALPPDTLVDGEIVICDDEGWVDFGALQARLGTARNTVATVALERPAILMVFDVLRLASVSWVSEPLAVRRRELTGLLDHRDPCLQVVDQTDDLALAQAWLSLPNVEGVVAKRADRPYVAGRGRDWVKVKRQRSVDCVVVGLAGELATPKLVLALQHSDGRLHHLGRLGGCHLSSSSEPACVAEGSSALRRPARRSLATARTPPTSGRSRMRSTSDNSRGVRGSMRAGANNAIRELGGLFGVGVLALEEFQNAWHELFVVLEDAAVSGVLVKPASTAGRRYPPSRRAMMPG